jgi:diguanylate cyclase (GGDEF)-like protein/putative nucleotidyltransferase with HDIG domain
MPSGFLRGGDGNGALRRVWRQPADRVRALSIASGLVFGALMLVVLLLAIRTETGVESVKSGGQGARGFGTVSAVVNRQDVLLHEYGRTPVRSEFDHSTARVRSSLSLLRDDPDAAATANRLSELYESFIARAERFIAMVNAGNTERALAFNLRRVDPVYETVASAAQDASFENADAVDEGVVALENRSEAVLTLLPIAFVLAGGLLFFLTWAGRRTQRDAAEARAEVRLLEGAALDDSLTGLRNHRAFEEDLVHALAQAGRENERLCLLMLDLDGLKLVNDTQGHQAGDARLRQVADALRATVRGPGSCYRIGGDEFAILLPGHGAWASYAVAEQLRGELASGSTEIDVAIGIAESAEREGKFELARHADVALINAKRSHRRVVVHSKELQDDLREDSKDGEGHHMRVLATALARAVDAKDAYTRSHSETVSNLCVLIATELELDASRVRRLRLAGLLHDVGKIGTPDAILNKPDPLTDAEYEEMTKHPVLGANIARAADLEEEAEWILHHHERLDGRGYPDGLEGTEVPLESRIILVADAFEAMTSDRPYRKGRPEAGALEELERHAGTQFDPNCVAALCRGLGSRTRPSGASGGANGHLASGNGTHAAGSHNGARVAAPIAR